MRVLILGCAEICFNPRLVKAADSFLAEGWPVTVYSPYLGNIDRGRYTEYVRRRDWRVVTFDLSRQSPMSCVRWLFASAFQQFCAQLWAHGSRMGFRFVLNKATVGLRVRPKDFDLVLLNLVDNLPLAVGLKRKNPQLTIIYDSQEYFQGQYGTEGILKQRWVKHAEKDGMPSVDYLLATTNVMKERLVRELAFPPARSYRVRNVPYEAPRIPERHYESNASPSPLRLVWHGLRIYYRNRRGVYLIVESLAAASCNAELFIQGIPVDKEIEELRREIGRLGIAERVHLMPPADPDQIVQSLFEYDIGVAGEIPEEENQMVTSSNKLFEFIAAGLATLTPDLPGLRETVSEYRTGLLFNPGDPSALAQAIERLDKDRSLLREFQRNSERVSQNELKWNRDFMPLIRELRR